MVQSTRQRSGPRSSRTRRGRCQPRVRALPLALNDHIGRTGDAKVLVRRLRRRKSPGQRHFLGPKGLQPVHTFFAQHGSWRNRRREVRPRPRSLKTFVLVDARRSSVSGRYVSLSRPVVVVCGSCAPKLRTGTFWRFEELNDSAGWQLVPCRRSRPCCHCRTGRELLRRGRQRGLSTDGLASSTQDRPTRENRPRQKPSAGIWSPSRHRRPVPGSQGNDCLCESVCGNQGKVCAVDSPGVGSTACPPSVFEGAGRTTKAIIVNLVCRAVEAQPRCGWDFGVVVVRTELIEGNHVPASFRREQSFNLFIYRIKWHCYT